MHLTTDDDRDGDLTVCVSSGGFELL